MDEVALEESGKTDIAAHKPNPANKALRLLTSAPGLGCSGSAVFIMALLYAVVMLFEAERYRDYNEYVAHLDIVGFRTCIMLGLGVCLWVAAVFRLLSRRGGAAKGKR